jgi:phage tail-like protein
MIKLGDNLYKKFPKLYKAEDINNDYALQRFMQILGGGFDELEGYIGDFTNTSNVDLCPAPLLPMFAEMFGFEFPFDMDEATQRKFIKVIPFLYQFKGSDKAFKYLAREIFGEGTVTETRTLHPPDGVTWDEWVNDPLTKDDWQKILVSLQVDGETLFLNNREVNFAKFADLLRPANRKIVSDLILFYSDIRDASLTQEIYGLTTVDSTDLETYARDTKVIEDIRVDSLHVDPENELYDITTVGEFDSDDITINPEEDIRTKLMYDESPVETTDSTDDETFGAIIKEEVQTVENSSILDTDLSTASRLDDYLLDDSSITDSDLFTATKDDIYDLTSSSVNPEDETIVMDGTEVVASSITTTSTSTLVNTGSKLVTSFKLTNFTPAVSSFSY